MRKKTLAQKLFGAFVGWFVVYMILLLGIAILTMTITIYRNVDSTRQELIQSMNENIQNYFVDMDDFSMELSNSTVFKNVAAKELPEAYRTGKSTVGLFSTLYQEAYRMIQKGYHVGILVENQYYVWMGQNYFIDEVDGASISTYDDLVRDETAVIKYLPYNAYLKGRNGESESPSYVTLSRSMSRNRPFLNGQEILEIQVETGEFVSDLMEMMGTESERNIQLHIYDTDGRQLYGESDLDLNEYVQGTEERTLRKAGNIITVERIFNDRLTVIYTMDLASYYQKIAWFLGIALLVGLTMIGIMILHSYRISKETSKPIHEICEHVKKIDLAERVGYENIETDIEEINFLSSALYDMSEDLQRSLEQIIAMKDYEIHAKMLALQAQMQPHFLFNTLMMIGSLAKEQDNMRIYNICMHLTSMFRYIAADAGEGVGLFEEIRHVEHYVEIMKERFPESRVEIDIPLEIMSAKIPKLTIQPLVENAFKYCNREKPDIRVIGEIGADGGWQITVQDNGPGFSGEDRRNILQKCEESLADEKLLSNQIDGMGLINVYVRLRLFYQDEMIYEIGENKGMVTIGRRTTGDDGKRDDQNHGH